MPASTYNNDIHQAPTASAALVKSIASGLAKQDLKKLGVVQKFTGILKNGATEEGFSNLFVVELKTLVDKAVDSPTPTLLWETLAQIIYAFGESTLPVLADVVTGKRIEEHATTLAEVGEDASKLKLDDSELVAAIKKNFLPKFKSIIRSTTNKLKEQQSNKKRRNNDTPLKQSLSSPSSSLSPSPSPSKPKQLTLSSSDEIKPENPKKEKKENENEKEEKEKEKDEDSVQETDEEDDGTFFLIGPKTYEFIDSILDKLAMPLEMFFVAVFSKISIPLPENEVTNAISDVINWILNDKNVEKVQKVVEAINNALKDGTLKGIVVFVISCIFEVVVVAATEGSGLIIPPIIWAFVAEVLYEIARFRVQLTLFLILTILKALRKALKLRKKQNTNTTAITQE